MRDKTRKEDLFDDWLLDNRAVLMSDFIERKVWEEWQNYLAEEFSCWVGDKCKEVPPIDPYKQEQSNTGQASAQASNTAITTKKGGDEKMKFDNEPLDKEILDRLQQQGILLSDNCPPMNKEKALVLLGEAMLNNFIREFTRLWKEELFPHCLLRDYEATGDELHKILHGT